jgi:lipopolysaccharide export system protein LptC
MPWRPGRGKAGAAVSVELHLPDLPEVPLSVGAAGRAPRPHMPWHLRLRDLLSAYLPLLLMALLALATWWLVKHSPHASGAPEARPPSSEPDYTMTEFAVERFDAQGRLELRVEGAQMRHFPDTDHIEVDRARIRAIAPDGRVTLAQAQRAVGNGDGSELQLLGGAEVQSTDAAGAPLLMRGEFLHAFLVTERVKSHLPVLVAVGASTLSAAGLDFDHGAGRLVLQGPVRAQLAPRTKAGR